MTNLPPTYLNCKFSQIVWGRSASKTANAAARVSGHSIRGKDFCIEDLIESNEKFQPKSVLGLALVGSSSVHMAYMVPT